MGSWSVCCGISNIAITSGNKCILLPLKKNRGGSERDWQPATLPIFGEYNDYGGIEEIEHDDNTKLIEEHFGVTIEEFAVFLVDGKFTYDRGEADEVAEKIKEFDEKRFEEIENWRFMWIDRQVYEFMTTNLNQWYEGVLDYGTPEILKLLGFEFVKQSNDLQNYDPKRFNQLWRKGDVEMFSDKNTLLSKDNQYVYAFGRGVDNATSIEHYFEVPEELNYLKKLHKNEAWRLLSKTDAKEELGYILGSRYEFEMDIFSELLEKTSKELEKITPVLAFKKSALHKKYYYELDQFGDRIAQLINVSQNLHPMSGEFKPHTLYLTPQCGEYDKHQILLDKFAEINKGYLKKYEE